MSLNEQIEKDYVAAYKEKNQVRLNVLRLLKTAVKHRLVELCRPHGALNDDELMDVIIKQAKQRQDSIDQYKQANRADLAEKEAKELEILNAYLPRKMSADELAKVIDDAISKTGASSPRDMGKVMGVILGAHKGQVDGKELSEAVKKRLSGN